MTLGFSILLYKMGIKRAPADGSLVEFSKRSFQSTPCGSRYPEHVQSLGGVALGGSQTPGSPHPPWLPKIRDPRNVALSNKNTVVAVDRAGGKPRKIRSHMSCVTSVSILKGTWGCHVGASEKSRECLRNNPSRDSGKEFSHWLAPCPAD